MKFLVQKKYGWVMVEKVVHEIYLVFSISFFILLPTPTISPPPTFQFPLSTFHPPILFFFFFLFSSQHSLVIFPTFGSIQTVLHNRLSPSEYCKGFWCVMLKKKTKKKKKKDPNFSSAILFAIFVYQSDAPSTKQQF